MEEQKQKSLRPENSGETKIEQNENLKSSSDDSSNVPTTLKHSVPEDSALTGILSTDDLNEIRAGDDINEPDPEDTTLEPTIASIDDKDLPANEKN